MSIATDEAEKKYPAPTDVDDPMYKYVEAIAGYPSAKRQGYIAGRTAEPTEAEIEAAIAAYLIHNMSFTHCDPPQPCTCGLEFPSKKSRAEHVFGEILKAARKAVTE